MNFEDFHLAITGNVPFAWQSSLACRVSSDEGWPGAVTLPTGLGKSALLLVALWSMAFRDESPRRVVWTVNRRILVNDAHESLVAISARLRAAKVGDSLHPVASALMKRFGRPDFDIFLMRGGMDERVPKIISAESPTFIVGTVDHLGSRLLFRGYGASEGYRPIIAGLLAHDTVWLVDEAHIVAPFIQTLRAVERRVGEDSKRTGIPKPMRVVEITATSLHDNPPRGTFALGEPDDAVRVRLSAPKPSDLVAVDKRAKLEDEIASRVKECLANGHTRIAVIVNRVVSARSIWHKLDTDKEIKADIELLVGMNRPYAANRLKKRSVAMRALSAKNRNKPERPAIVVATQTIEVGVNLDCDMLITELAPFSSLVQRFGRLNRLGLYPKGQVGASIIAIETSDLDKDPIYGESLLETLALLRRFPLPLDFSPSGVAKMLDGLDEQARRPLQPPTHKAEPLTNAQLARLSQTFPAPANGPTADAFLHGVSTPEDALVCWRSDVKKSERIVNLPPATAGEMLSIPLSRLTAWMNGSDKRVATTNDTLDAALNEADEDHVQDESKATPIRFFPLLLWDDEKEVWDRIDDLRAFRRGAKFGCIVALDTNVGGCAPNGWDPQDAKTPVESLQIAASLIRRKGEIVGGTVGLGVALRERGRREVAIEWMKANIEREDEAGDCARAMHLALDRRNCTLDTKLGGSGEDSRVEWFAWTASDRLDERRTNRSQRPVSLLEHSKDVSSATYAAAERLGLPAVLRDALRDAGLYHDFGKADHRMQRDVFGNVDTSTDAATLLAKSPNADEKRDGGDWPSRERHEAISVSVCGSPDPLIRHLVGTHHGHGRPWFKTPDPSEPESVELHFDGTEYAGTSDHGLYRLDSGWLEQFDDLLAEYGSWGLAYLEAILRLSDWACSEESQRPRNVVQEAS